jgi:hypothetical protein
MDMIMKFQMPEEHQKFDDAFKGGMFKEIIIRYQLWLEEKMRDNEHDTAIYQEVSTKLKNLKTEVLAHGKN